MALLLGVGGGVMVLVIVELAMLLSLIVTMMDLLTEMVELNDKAGVWEHADGDNSNVAEKTEKCCVMVNVSVDRVGNVWVSLVKSVIVLKGRSDVVCDCVQLPIFEKERVRDTDTLLPCTVPVTVREVNVAVIVDTGNIVFVANIEPVLVLQRVMEMVLLRDAAVVNESDGIDWAVDRERRRVAVPIGWLPEQDGEYMGVAVLDVVLLFGATV